ncbi:MAG: PH domain-containing protein, partial [Corynebacterium flavescens]|uniref:PH domain-containing protein n=2 Tax=Corynebacteriaceae TaxID=1653 RepID=UPI003F8FF7BD
MALEKFEGWTFYQPCPIPDDIQSVLAVNEQPSCAFKTVRDAAVFTNYRLIIRDS